MAEIKAKPIDPRSLAAKVKSGEIEPGVIENLSQNEKVALGIALRAANMLQRKLTPAQLRMDERKRKLLSSIERLIKSAPEEGKDFEYPDIVTLGLKIGIPPGTLGRYLSEDKELRSKIDEIEKLCLQDCRKTVFTAKSKQPFLALQLLQAKEADFAPKQIVSGSVAHYHVISHVRTEKATSEPIPNIQQAEFQEVGAAQEQ